MGAPRRFRIRPTAGVSQSVEAIIIALRDARLDAGLTIAKVERKTGLNAKTLSHRERGRCEPFKVIELLALLDAYGEEPVDFFQRVEEIRKVLYAE